MTHDARQTLAAVGLVALLAPAGCATPYAYEFHLAGAAVGQPARPGGAQAIEDADVRADIVVDVTAAAIYLNVTNKTDQVLQIGWAAITLSHPDGSVTALRPDVDLGWLPPHATVSGRLVALALPHSGDEAAAYEGRRFQLNVPVVVRRQPKLYQYAFVAHVHAI